jgi:hypothetical protein
MYLCVHVIAVGPLGYEYQPDGRIIDRWFNTASGAALV